MLTCSFGNFLEEALRDRLICSLAHSSMQKKLLTAAEMTVLQGTQLIAEQDSEEVHRLNYERQCQCCGESDPTTACQFCQSTCYSCGECSHMQVMCKRGKKLTSGKPQNNQISLKDDNEDDTTIWTITGGHTVGYHTHLKLNQKPVKWSWILVLLYLSCQNNNGRHCLQRANHSGSMRENHYGGIQVTRCK